MSAPLTVRKLHIRHFAGVREENAFSLENLSPEINVIYGPNGCGKSTSARALQQLLWPDSKAGHCDLTAGISREDRNWELAARGREVFVLSGNERLPHPAWAPPETRGRYHWSLQNLLQEKDGELARQIAREMAGGVDFEKLAADLNLNRKASAPRALHQRFQAAERKLREAQELQQALKRESAKLSDLKEACEKALEKSRSIPMLDQALELMEKSAQLRSLQERLTTYPPGLENIQGDDADRLARLLKEEESFLQEQEELKQEKFALGMGEEEWATVSEADFQQARKELAAALEEIRELKRNCKQAEQDFQQAETAQQALQNSIGIHARAALDLEEGFAYPELRQWISTIMREAALSERVELLREGIPEAVNESADADSLREARRILENWLTRPTPGHALSQAGLLGAMLLLMALLLHLCLQKDFSWLWMLLLAPPPALQLLSQSIANRRDQEKLRQEFPSDIPAPESWSPEQVQNRLRELEKELRTAHTESLNEVDRRRLQEAESKLTEQREKIESLRAELRAAGLEPEADMEWLGHFLQTVQAWREQRVQTRVAEEHWNQRLEEHSHREQLLKDKLKTWGQRENAGDPASAVEQISERMQQEISRRGQLHQLDAKFKHGQQQLQRIREEKALLGERAGMNPPDLNTLRDRVAMLPEWEKEFRHSEQLQVRVSELRNQLGEALTTLPNDPEGLLQARSAAEEALQEERKLREQISRLEQRIEDQRKGRGVHEAHESLQSCREELQTAREAQFSLLMGQQLLDWLQEKCRNLERSEVLREANRNLGLFSKGTLELQLSREGNQEAFMAASPGYAPRPLRKLSSGERTQVLMAVRLAFLNLHEHAPLPLLVDEALGTTDDRRGEELIRSLIEVSRQGRQIFYFTAQLDEVQKWRQVMQQENMDGNFIDLEALRRRKRAAALPDLQAMTEAPIDVDRQQGETLQAWAARLQVPVWSPRQPLEDLHLWHLLHDDEALLQTLLQREIHTVGNWLTYDRAGALAEWIPQGSREQIQHAINLLRELQKAWQIGRPPPVSTPAVLMSGAVTDKFSEAVSELIVEVKGDAADLIQALQEGRVKGFYKQKISELSASLHEQGYLSDQTALSDQEIRAQAMATEAGSKVSTADWQKLSRFFFACCPGFRLE